ncbi:MAG: radical SAM protein [Archangiaceae bacterium]|nr:radical SAM protein [Archangiaceae bacterium]
MGPSKLPQAVVAQRPDLIPEDWSETHTLLATFGFHCNLACTFCMVEDVLGVYRGADLKAFRAFLENPTAMRDIRRVSLSGGEATMEKELVEYVRLARRAPGVEHVRVQTNATRLANPALLGQLIAEGVDEFFVSIHGHDAALCDALTQRPGSFKAIMAGIEAIAKAGATLLTNTVIVAQNHTHLADIVEVVAPFKPRTADLWNLWPRIDADDTRGSFVRVSESLPGVVKALEACERHGITPVLKWFPHCLLGRFAKYHDDSQPTVLVEQQFWEKAPRFACLYQGICEHSPKACAGLTHAYVKRYGWEQDLLQPKRSAEPRKPSRL